MRQRWLAVSAFLFGSELEDALDDGGVFVVQTMGVVSEVGLVQLNIFLSHIVNFPFVYLFTYDSNPHNLFFDEV